MQTKYAEKGLTIVALTESGADKFVKDNKINYPVGLGGPNAQNYGITGIPQTYLINHRGKVVWEGHTASDSEVEALLAKVLVFPKREWPKGMEKAARAAEGGALGESSKLLAKYKADASADADAVTVLEGYIQAKVDGTFADVDEMEKDGDYYAANAVLTGAKKGLAGHEAADKVAEKLKAYGKDKAIQGQIKAGALFEQAQALELAKKPKDAFPLYVQAAKLGAGTKIGDRAKAKAEELAPKR